MTLEIQGTAFLWIKLSIPVESQLTAPSHGDRTAVLTGGPSCVCRELTGIVWGVSNQRISWPESTEPDLITAVCPGRCVCLSVAVCVSVCSCLSEAYLSTSLSGCGAVSMGVRLRVEYILINDISAVARNIVIVQIKMRNSMTFFLDDEKSVCKIN